MAMRSDNDAVVRNVIANDEPVAGIPPAQPHDRPARPHAAPISVDQQRQQQLWRERRLARANDFAGRLEVAKVHKPDSIHNDVEDVALGQPVHYVDRYKEALATIRFAEELSHGDHSTVTDKHRG